MKTSIITIAILTAFAAAPAFATPGNNGGGNGGCGVGQQTNGCGGQGGQGGQGGAGGQGGQGGNGYGGQGGAVIGSGNSANTNRNDNQNTNLQGQAQGQLQGQQQGQGQAQGQIANGGSASSSSGASSTSSSGGNTLTGGTQSATQANAVTVNGDTVTYEAQKRDPVASAWAAPLTASNGTCMGSSSGGIQGAVIGISGASTWTDKSCDARYDAISLNSLGQSRAAIARLCQKAEIADAMQAAGTPCPSTVEKKAAAVTTGATVSSAHSDVFVN